MDATAKRDWQNKDARSHRPSVHLSAKSSKFSSTDRRCCKDLNTTFAALWSHVEASGCVRGSLEPSAGDVSAATTALAFYLEGRLFLSLSIHSNSQRSDDPAGKICKDLSSKKHRCGTWGIWSTDSWLINAGREDTENTNNSMQTSDILSFSYITHIHFRLTSIQENRL